MRDELIIGIVDDNPSDRQDIQQRVDKILKKCHKKYSYKLYCDGSEIIASETVHDIIFLDHNMPIMNGLDTMVELNKLQPKPLVIFITGIANPFEVVQASVSLHPFDFLLKSDSDERLERVLLRAIGEVKSRQQIEITHYRVFKDDKVVKAKELIYLSEIASLTADGKTCYISTNSGDEYATKKPLTFWFNKLPQDEFAYIRKSVIVNLKSVEKFEEQIVYLVNSDELAVSRHYRKKFEEMRWNYLLFKGFFY